MPAALGTLRTLGASVRGPAHRAEAQLNQDAWAARSGPRGTLAVVCDGMGSRPLARQGARAAVAAAQAAAAHWLRSPCGRPEDLVRLIEVLWRLRLGSTDPDSAATTCMVCALRPDGSGAAVQLGDGLIGLRRADGEFVPLTAERQGFGSVSLALGTPHRLDDWGLHALPPLPKGAALLLASDGVADDLRPERRAAFVSWLVDDVAQRPRAAVHLSRQLRAWPVPHHRDDKTLALLWNPS